MLLIIVAPRGTFAQVGIILRNIFWQIRLNTVLKYKKTVENYIVN
jgi:hypothetical protein